MQCRRLAAGKDGRSNRYVKCIVFGLGGCDVKDILSTFRYFTLIHQPRNFTMTQEVMQYPLHEIVFMHVNCEIVVYGS